MRYTLYLVRYTLYLVRYTVLGDVHAVLGEVHTALGEVHTVLGEVHTVLGEVHAVLGEVHILYAQLTSFTLFSLDTGRLHSRVDTHQNHQNHASEFACELQLSGPDVDQSYVSFMTRSDPSISCSYSRDILE